MALKSTKLELSRSKTNKLRRIEHLLEKFLETSIVVRIAPLSFLRALNFLRQSTVSCRWTILATRSLCCKRNGNFNTWLRLIWYRRLFCPSILILFVQKTLFRIKRQFHAFNIWIFNPSARLTDGCSIILSSFTELLRLIVTYTNPGMPKGFIWTYPLGRVHCQHLVDQVLCLGRHSVPLRRRILGGNEIKW